MAACLAWVEGLAVRTRFVAVVAVVLGLVALTFFSYYPRQLQEATRQSMEARARGLAETVAIGVAVGLELFDLTAITAAFDFARQDPDFDAVLVLDTDGEVVGQFGDIDLTGADPDRLQVTMPITYRADPLGEVVLWMSLDGMNVTMARQQRTGLAMCVGLFGVGILLTVVGARPITRPLAQLAAAADEVALGHLDARLPRPGPNEIGRLSGAFEHMRQAVQQSVQRLTAQSAEMRLMLDHLEEGLFTFNPDLSINPQHSRRTSTILGVRDVPAAAWPALFPVDEPTLDAFRKWVTLMANLRDTRQLARYGELFPIEEFVRDTPTGRRHVRVTCRPIVQDDQVRRFLVLVMDVTDQRRAQELSERRVQQQARDSERVLALVRSDQRDSANLLERCDAVVTTLAAASGENADAAQVPLRREVHTLKGNSGSFGFSELATALGAVEASLYEVGDATPHEASALTDALGATRAELRRIAGWRAQLFDEQGDRVGVDHAAYDALLRAVEESRNGGPPDLLERLRNLVARPFGDHARRYQRFVARYRDTYGKGLGDLVVLTPAVLVRPDTMRTLDECIVQLLRNAADHGIETDAERAAAGKGPGRISIAARRVDDSLEVTVSDDGRGIDREAVTHAAVAAGAIEPDEVARLSDEARLRLTLYPGVTTRGAANEMSGRGVGLEVVAELMRRAGGEVVLCTETARGSHVTLRLPVDHRSALGAGQDGGVWLES